MRIIDADMLKARLDDCTTKGMGSTVAFMLKHMIDEQPSVQPESNWIPCSERLPEKRGFYLTTTKDKAVYCDHWNEDNFDRTEMVIAWMPLPAPYKGDDTE